MDEQAQRTMGEELEQIYADTSETRDGILSITAGEYLEVIATRR